MRKFKKKTTIFNPPKTLKKTLIPNTGRREKVTRSNLEEKVRQQTDELEVRKGQLRKGADREKLGADREKLGAGREKLAEEQIYIRTKAMESTSDGIFIIDAQKPDFPVVYANQSFYTMTGYAKKEILGKSYFLHYGPNTDPRIIEEIKRALLQGKSFHGEMLHFKKNGEKYWNLLRITPVRDAGGTVTHYIGIKTDVTLMRQRNLEIKEKHEELLHVTRVGMLAEFVSSLAHEISQPLTAILSYAQAAQRMIATGGAKGEADRESQLQEILGYIIKDNQRATEVIRRLRSLLKKGEPALESIDINALINETVTIIATDVTVRNKVLKTELATDLPRIRGDRVQLQQVLLNLISNSLEAMEADSDSREMLVRTSRKDPNTIMVEVKDSGSGISAQSRAKLFTHFFTSKPNGLGMGLPISRSIVEAHGGRLEAENNPDRGATFYFTIPVNMQAADER